MRVEEFYQDIIEVFDAKNIKPIIKNEILARSANNLWSLDDMDKFVLGVCYPFKVKNVHSWVIVKQRGHYYAVGVNENPSYGLSPQRAKISNEEYFNEYVLGLAHQMNDIMDLEKKSLSELQREYAEWEIKGFEDDSIEDVDTVGMSKEDLILAIYDYRVFN